MLVVVLLLWPLGILVSFAVTPGAAASILARAGTWQTAGMATTQAVLSTALSLIFGLPVGYVVGHLRFPGRRLLRWLATLPVVLPAIVVALAYQQYVGRGGWVNLALDAAGRDRKSTRLNSSH